jgi:riboflavin-specific deaminase-like protein
MRQLLPVAVDAIDPVACYLDDERPPVTGRPWLLINMVTSADGATATDGRSGGLGGPGDRRIFFTLRALADVVLVGAGTVRAEGYGPVKLADEQRARREAGGRPPLPRLAIISRRLDVDRHGALFAPGVDPPIVITSPGADRVRRAELADAGADLVLAGNGDDVDLVTALRTLGEMGSSVVLCEGGPTLNGALLHADLVDELCLTIAPRLIGGESARAIHGPDRTDAGRLLLRRVLEEDGSLFLRYTR